MSGRPAARDSRRRDDYDGRGRLSEHGLFLFCRFYLETVLDPVVFMDGLLKLADLRTRIARYFTYEALHLTRYREEIMRVVCALVDEGELARERVSASTGKGMTTRRQRPPTSIPLLFPT